MFESFYQWSPSILDSYVPSPFPKQSFVILGGHLTGIETIENLHRDNQKMATVTK